LIRVDLAALLRGHITTGELCEIGGVSVSVTELRRLLGDSVMQLVLTNGEAVIDVVNLNRKPSVAQMIAKLFHDATCSVEGCDRAARLEFDHRDDWARVQVTELANLDLLCDHHHDKKTYENWQLIAGTGRRPMVPPEDPCHPDHAANRGQDQHPGQVRVPDPSQRPNGAPEPGGNAVPRAGEVGAPPGRDGPNARRDGGVGRVGGVLNPEFAACIARISRKEAEHQAQLRSQNSLFEPG